LAEFVICLGIALAILAIVVLWNFYRLRRAVGLPESWAKGWNRRLRERASKTAYSHIEWSGERQKGPRRR